MTEILDVTFRKILDSRGNPTIEVDVDTIAGFGRAAAPSGASTGAHEVQAWPDGGVDAAVEQASDLLARELVGMDATAQRAIDDLLVELDGTEDFGKLGGNVTVALSLAVAKAAADDVGLPLYVYLGGVFAGTLPRPLGNVLGGGAHAVGGTTIQEFMAVALGPTFAASVFANADVHKRVKAKLKNKFPDTPIAKGDEGAWVAPMADRDALRLVAEAAEETSDAFGFPVRVGLDVAATEFFRDGAYHYKDQSLKPEEQVSFMAELVEEFDLFSVEDPLAEDDWESWKAFTREVGGRCLVVGDDLFTTNISRIERGITEGSANAVLVKPNQIGTLSRTVDAIRMSHDAGFATIVSHRSGETTDATIAHIAAAFGSRGIKTGAVGGERTAKLNELIRMEEGMG